MERSLSINAPRHTTTTSESESSREYQRNSNSQLFDDVQYSRLEQPAFKKESSKLQSALDLNRQTNHPGTAEVEELELQHYVVQAAPSMENTIENERQYHDLEPPASIETPETEALYATPSKRVPQASRRTDNDGDYHHLERSLSINAPRHTTTTSESESSREYQCNSNSQLFDDVQYSRLEQPAVKKVGKASTLPSKASQENEKLYTQSSNDLQESGGKGSSSYNHLEKHKYTPIVTTLQNTRHVYSHPIVSTPEMYISERGHVYQILETSVET